MRIRVSFESEVTNDEDLEIFINILTSQLKMLTFAVFPIDNFTIQKEVLENERIIQD